MHALSTYLPTWNGRWSCPRASAVCRQTTYAPTHPSTRLAARQVKYKNVMKQYNLGPNGGILTSCNLFATRFDQVRR